MPKTIIINLKLFKFGIAKRLPIYVSRHVKMKGLKKGSFIISSERIKPFMIRIGNGGLYAIAPNRKSLIHIVKDGKIVFYGTANLSKGLFVRVGGRLEIGDNFYANSNLSVICSASIKFGKNVLIGWNVSFRDCDGHKILKNGETINANENITVGNHVWVCQDVCFLKGSGVLDDCVVGMGSLVTKFINLSNALIVGSPAKVVKEDISWVE